MVPSTTSDMASLLIRSARLNTVRADAQRSESELLSGRRENVAMLGASSTIRVQRIGLDLTRIEADQQSLTFLRTRTERTEVALQDISNQTAAITQDLLGNASDPAAIERRGDDAKYALAGMLNLMEQTGSRDVNIDALLDDLGDALDGAADPAAELTSYFERGGVFDLQFPQNPQAAMPVLSDGRAPMRAMNFDTDGVRAAVAGYAALAVRSGDKAEALDDLGLELLLNAQDGLTAQRTAVGSQIARIDDMQTAAATRETALNIERNALDGVDPYEAATRLQAYQDRLETTLILTRRMADLTLVRYL